MNCVPEIKPVLLSPGLSVISIPEYMDVFWMPLTSLE